MPPSSRRVFRAVLVVTPLLMLGGYLAWEPLGSWVAANLIYDGRAEWELQQTRERVAKGEIDDATAIGRCLAIARENSGSWVELATYAYLTEQWPETAEQESVLDAMRRAIQTTPIDELARCFDRRHLGAGPATLPFSNDLVARAQRSPDHPRAAKLLTEAALLLKPDESADAPPVALVQIADLVRERYAASPDLVNLCEAVGNSGAPARWTRPFEPHVRHIVEVNPDRLVRCSAHYALATIVRSHGIDRQDEAVRLYQQHLERFDGETAYPGQAIEQFYRGQAESALKAIGLHGLGALAPLTRGVDLEGNAISLEHYRGRVVLVSFWASSCGPCLRAVPHEQALLERFDARDFAIVGMNADTEVDAARNAATRYGIDWPSVHLASRSENRWIIDGLPTFGLLDRRGVVRGLWTGLPPDAELQGLIRDLIDSDPGQ